MMIIKILLILAVLGGLYWLGIHKGNENRPVRLLLEVVRWLLLFGGVMTLYQLLVSL